MKDHNVSQQVLPIVIEIKGRLAPYLFVDRSKEHGNHHFRSSRKSMVSTTDVNLEFFGFRDNTMTVGDWHVQATAFHHVLDNFHAVVQIDLVIHCLHVKFVCLVPNILGEGPVSQASVREVSRPGYRGYCDECCHEICNVFLCHVGILFIILWELRYVRRLHIDLGDILKMLRPAARFATPKQVSGGGKVIRACARSMQVEFSNRAHLAFVKWIYTKQHVVQIPNQEVIQTVIVTGEERVSVT
mmetsp:Transcript_29536/g.43562  ORF Transcript_29536/g.43562 Transcript_29536/m.43562 type:complete len:243 (+) Transcript_29536:320-1048(+)